VVVSPLIALMKDQVDSLRELGIAASQLDSSLSAEDRRIVSHDLRSGNLHLLFVSPERLVTSDSLQQMLRECNVNTFAIDEAHCISHWGHDFRPEYRQLARLKEFFPGATVHAFTATATQQVRRDIAAQLKLEEPELLVGNFDRPNLTYRVLPRRDMFAQIREVLDRHPNEAGIIYAMRRKDVDDISKSLAADKTLKRKVGGYHAGMSPELRRRIQEEFIGEKLDVVVATIAFGMGIDRSNLRFVLHVAMPKSVEAYQQETGRAGRDGLEAECVLLYSASDTISWRSLIEKSVTEAGSGGTKLDPKYLPSALKHIDDMDLFARSATCRHKSLVEYFGQKYQPPAPLLDPSDDPETENSKPETANSCGACDMCLGDTTPVPDSTTIAQKILSAIARTDQRFGAGHIISVLRGENLERIRSLRHDQLSTYGLLNTYAQTELRDFIYQLLGQGAITQENLALANGRSAPILKLNAMSVEIMRGHRQARLIQIVRKSTVESGRSRGSEISWEGVDEELFEILRALRKQIAMEKCVAPYIVFADRSLRELAQSRPTTMRGFRMVYGSVARKEKEFGWRIIDAIKQYCQSHALPTDLPLNPITGSPPAAPAGISLSISRSQATDHFRREKSIDQVAAIMNRAKSTVTQYLVEYIAAEKPVSITPWVPETIYKQVAVVAIETGNQPMKVIFVKLEEKVPYEQIRLVVAHLRSKGAL
jgi:ATP-dependent DNA helicase RecQ